MALLHRVSRRRTLAALQGCQNDLRETEPKLAAKSSAQLASTRQMTRTSRHPLPAEPGRTPRTRARRLRLRPRGVRLR